MPVLIINTNIKIERDSALSELSSLCTELLNKPEAYVMVQINQQQTLMFAGTTEAAAHCSLTSLGLSAEHTAQYSDKLCHYLEAHLNVPADRVYIEFKSPERRLFGWNKGTF